MIESLLISKQPIPRHILNSTLLQYLKKEDQDSVSEAFYFVVDYYREANIVRDNGYPGEIHMVNVATILDFDPDLMKVALLHDFLEDIPKTKSEFKKLSKLIKERFGKTIHDAVLELTKEKEEPYHKYIQRINSKICLIVKEADMLENIRTNYSLTLKKRKHNLPWKVDIFLRHLSNQQVQTISLYDHAFYKYYAKIIEEIFRMHENHLKNMADEHKFYSTDIKYFDKLLFEYYDTYSIIRKDVYRKFVIGLVEDNNARAHLRIELKKRIKEALTNTLPLNSMLISIDQNLFLLKKAENQDKYNQRLLDAITQQIKYARLEAFRLAERYKILSDNKVMLDEDYKNDILLDKRKLKGILEANKKLEAYAKLVESIS